MIKFFRKIRQNLLNEGKTSKYFKYAIGEIFLVVIGILIALQINNWNENRKYRDQENQYINRLLIENKKNITTFTNEIKRLEKNNLTIINFSDALNTKTGSDSLLIQIANDYMVVGSVYPIFNPSTSTYKDITSTGNLNLIENAKLREQIVRHYEAYEYVEENFQININWAIPIDAPLFIETNAIKFDSKYTKSLFSEQPIKNLANELYKNETIFLRNIAMHYWINKDCIDRLLKINEETRTLVHYIDSLAKKQNKND
jgi:hypothetical protein